MFHRRLIMNIDETRERYCIIHRENKHSECYGPYDSFGQAFSVCDKFLRSTGLSSTNERFGYILDSLLSSQEASVELPGGPGLSFNKKYSLQIVLMKSVVHFSVAMER